MMYSFDKRETVDERHGMRWLWGILSQHAVTSIIGLVTVLLTINQLFFLSRSVDIAAQSAQAAKQSADVAREALVTSNRPWVSILHPSIESPLTWNNQGARVTIGVEAKNIGRSPAFDVRTKIETLIFPGREETGLEAFCHGVKQGRIRQAGTIRTSSVLFPEEVEAERIELIFALKPAEFKGSLRRVNMCFLLLDDYRTISRNRSILFPHEDTVARSTVCAG